MTKPRAIFNLTDVFPVSGDSRYDEVRLRAISYAFDAMGIKGARVVVG
jgi:hypothetical protein